MLAGQAVVRDYLFEGLSEEERARAEAVVNLDAAEVTCPACGFTFASGPRECPDCGLFLG